MIARLLRRAGRRLLAVGLAASALATQGCDPCAGVARCDASALRLAHGGRMIEFATGRPVAGVRLTLVRRAGAVLARDTVVAVSGADGFFELAVAAREDGEVTADLVVEPPAPWAAYRLDGERLAVLRGRANAGDLGRLTVDPFVFFIGELRERRTGGVLFRSRVTFTRTGGVAIRPDSLSVFTDDFGRFTLALPAGAAGDVVGELRVDSPFLLRSVRIPGVRLRAGVRDRVPALDRVWRLGPGAVYVGELFDRGTDRRVANAEVEFRAVGGATVDPPRFTVRTDAAGRFPLEPNPIFGGDTIVADLVVRLPDGRPGTTIRGLRLPVFDTDEVRFLGTFGVGPSLRYVGELYRRGDLSRIGGAEVRFRRTGGIAVTPSEFTVTTTPDGRFPLVTAPADSGEVVGELLVRLPGLAEVERIPDVRMRTFDNDSVRLLRTWGVGGHLAYAGIAFLRATGEPARGVRATFRRTGGIAIRPDSFTVVSNEFGGFPLFAATTEEGEVVGDLVLEPPGPVRPTVRRGVRMRTFAADELRRLDNYGVGPSLRYWGEIRDAETGRPLVGAEVTFVRTGGLPAAPARITLTTNADGRFNLAPVPDGYGTLVGDLVVRTPAGTETTIRGVTLETFETDETRALGVWHVRGR